MVKLTQDMAEKWYQKMEELGQASSVEVEVEEAMIQLTADIIAGTQFGSSYKRGKKVFEHLEELKGFLIKYGHLLIIPGVRHVPLPPPFLQIAGIYIYVCVCVSHIVERGKAQPWKAWVFFSCSFL
jgi:cytochrome P450